MSAFLIRLSPTLLFVATGCAQPIQLTIKPDVCPACPDPVMVETIECTRAHKVLEIRKNKHMERLDECEQNGNKVLDCIHWVYGYVPEEDGQ